MQGVQVSIDREAAASLIGWWRDAGVDTLVDEEPRDWLAPQNSFPARERAVERSDPVALPSRSAPTSLSGGEELDLPPTLDALIAWMRESPGVPEARWGRTRLLPAGDPASGLMILTDMPEPGDAEAGRLMAGELGDLFDRMLLAMNRDRSSIWLAPMATVRSVGRIHPKESDRLLAITRHHIGLVAPRRLLLMGETPNRALIGPDWQAGRGAYHSINLGAVSVEAVATFHPRMLLQRPAYKAQAWKDLQLLMKGL